MGHLVMEYAWNKSSGIGVGVYRPTLSPSPGHGPLTLVLLSPFLTDIHVERITNRLGWHPKKTNTSQPTPELARYDRRLTPPAPSGLIAPPDS